MRLATGLVGGGVLMCACVHGGGGGGGPGLGESQGHHLVWSHLIEGGRNPLRQGVQASCLGNLLAFPPRLESRVPGAWNPWWRAGFIDGGIEAWDSYLPCAPMSGLTSPLSESIDE